jgi:acyl carrier protein
MYLVMGFGAVLALIGIVLFARKGVEDTNKIKMFGFEFELAGSALVIFVIGALIFLVPVLYREQFREPNQSSVKTDERRSPPPIAEAASQAQSAAPSMPQGPAKSRATSTPSSPRSVSSLPTEIRALVANHLKVKPEDIDMSTPLQLQRRPIHFDDLDFLQIVMKIGERYGVSIDDKDVNMDRVSIDDFARAVDKKRRAR